MNFRYKDENLIFNVWDNKTLSVYRPDTESYDPIPPDVFRNEILPAFLKTITPLTSENIIDISISQKENEILKLNDELKKLQMAKAIFEVQKLKRRYSISTQYPF